MRDLISAVKETVPLAAQPEAKADVAALLERVEQCRAVDPDDVKPIAQHHCIWEMRLDIRTHGLCLRIYETEIAELPAHIVALHAHRKVISGSPEDIRAAQDKEILVASTRWDDGRPQFWGL
ncbi:hypothetical protein ABTX24_18725 [Nocardioides sp. NPDC127514]|uniref:hypothetical protein n=1 Tax=unclassified Nocardioides TaxID=2615069 RepID=UPI003325C3D8